jgi:hypothetical protein
MAMTNDTLIIKSDEELLEWRANLIRESGASYESLRERAEVWKLTSDEQEIWETILAIDYVMGNG